MKPEMSKACKDLLGAATAVLADAYAQKDDRMRISFAVFRDLRDAVRQCKMRAAPPRRSLGEAAK